MDWKFWRNDNKSNEVGESLHKLEDKLDELNQQLENNENIIKKSLRLDYKSSQEILKNLNQINDKIDDSVDYDKKYRELEIEKNNILGEKDFIIEKTIQWLDDIDLIYDKIYEQDHGQWIQLLESWQKQIIESLEILKIYEIPVIGKTFNYELAEAASTVKKEEDKSYLPYEVVDVLQRGFIFGDGTLFRKAKVITIEEGEKSDYGQ